MSRIRELLASFPTASDRCTVVLGITRRPHVQRKGRIPVRQGAMLIGVMDEHGVLEHGEIFIRIHGPEQERAGSGPQVVVRDAVAVGRNPSLHAGDIRTLKAVDRPALRDLVNVVVFPAKGPRPHQESMSGGDLDGDEYFLIWDPDLVPVGPDPSPFDYLGQSTTEANHDGEVTVRLSPRRDRCWRCRNAFTGIVKPASPGDG